MGSGRLTFLALPALLSGESMGSEGGVRNEEGGGEDDSRALELEAGVAFVAFVAFAAGVAFATLGVAAGAAPALGAPKKLARLVCFMVCLVRSETTACQGVLSSSSADRD